MANMYTTYQCIVKGHNTNSNSGRTNTANVFYYQASPNSSPYNKDTFATAFQTNVWNGIAALLTNGWIGDSYVIRCLDFATDAAYVSTVVPTSGGGSSAELPNNVAVTINFLTALRGKSYRGRKSIGFPDPVNIQKDEIFSNLTAWKTAAAAMANAFTDGATVAWSPVLLSAKLTGAGLLTDPTSYVVTRITQSKANKTLGSSRHRIEKPRVIDS